MKMVYPISDLGCAVLRMSFSDWLDVREPEFFDVDEGDLYGFVQQIPSLYAYSFTVVLVKVGTTLFKLTGKRRKEAWVTGTLSKPDYLTALIFDMTELDFQTLCTKAKAKQFEALPPHEVVKAAYSELGLTFVSERLRNGFINEAIHIALRGRQRSLQDKRSIREREDINMKKAIELFKNELLLIDGLLPKSDIFTTGVLAGSLIMLGLNKPITEFLKRLNNNQGKTKDGLADPIECLLKAIHRHKISQRTMQPRMAIDLAKKTVHAIAIWLEGEQSAKYWRMRDLTGHELMPLIMELKQLKMKNAERDL
ncbi:hypothetical protein GO003_025665 [Methylicorpusculum oleiharenae]|uniref:hypothetical protein n=1 Tax=Methylicorpusculum oleiharenae TaxID=1338687 RepID=UPI00135BF0EA|nr:hypothetical protein [Methylicorpusculum oleiharenae]MCD2453332.1 hypothetical protein [Methylicorpusculum oleiharenae]MCD2453768.1 hypothetical protein [Methylicorpusculum oleiharenae]